MAKKFLYIFLAFITVLLLLVALAIEFETHVNADSRIQVDEAETIRPLLQEFKTLYANRRQPGSVEVTPLQANSLAGFLHRAHKNASAEVKYDDGSAEVKVSYQLSQISSSLFLNISAEVLSDNRLNIAWVKIGDLYLPGSFALWLAEVAANTYTSTEVATQSIAAVKQVEISPFTATLHVYSLQPVFVELARIETPGTSDGNRLLKSRTVHYLAVLDAVITARREQGTVSLIEYLHPLMREAHRQSEQRDPVLENEAVLMALSIYAGNTRFARLLGDFSEDFATIPSAPTPATLANRVDLSQHFIFSAAIKLASEQGVSIAVGEFKELMDRAKGGSGYSFVDLAADLAGVKFAVEMVSEKSARRMQEAFLNAPEEATIFPTIQQLEEGLSKDEFRKKYQQVDSVEYQRVVDDIQARLARLPIYQ